MRTDPRTACRNTDENLFWAVLHDFVAHPFMVVTNYSATSLRFHDWTSFRAWPRIRMMVGEPVWLASAHFGKLKIQLVAEGTYGVSHPKVAHKIVCRAEDAHGALVLADAWFVSLADHHVGDERFARMED